MPPKKQVTASLASLKPTDKVPLPNFLRLLNDEGMSMPNAMAVAAKVYKSHNTPEKLGALDAASLVKLGIEDKDRRTEILDAFRRFQPKGVSPSKPATPAPVALTSRSRIVGGEEDAFSFSSEPEVAEKEDTQGKTDKQRQERALNIDQRRRAALDAFQKSLGKQDKDASPSKKRKRGVDNDPFYDALAPPPADPLSSGIESFEFHEITDEEILATKHVKINRAPIMMAWSCVVAEKLGFAREEALSIASAYTEMNAVTRGANLGIYDKQKQKGMEPGSNTAQPHVELMGRRIPLFQTENGQWRALMKGDPVSPAKAFGYITRSLAQMTPYVVGALQIVANSYEDPQLLNQRGYNLYCDFRPENAGWGVVGDVKLSSILRNKYKSKPAVTEAKETTNVSKEAKPAGETFEEFEAKEEAEGGFTLWDLYDDDD